MVWVSNRTPLEIVVSITNKSGGSSADFTILPAIPYGNGIAEAEKWEHNHWTRKDTETLKVTAGGKDAKFEVQKDDRVNIYVDTYEIFTSQTTYF
ncbi:hypothetical protein PILCRDRAFT_825379 [Piloderma croceum F 1598]|uniref:Uncharacterized protein n=1 Tax=Piloderma croceum (strain F 1598) TaxID=765440 RepID=A0A0C3FCB7_PILCF|nr:hypothetical protein PILCRDRAFT_825379 [Piloderma croceum F 1598]